MYSYCSSSNNSYTFSTYIFGVVPKDRASHFPRCIPWYQSWSYLLHLLLIEVFHLGFQFHLHHMRSECLICIWSALTILCMVSIAFLARRREFITTPTPRLLNNRIIQINSIVITPFHHQKELPLLGIHLICTLVSNYQSSRDVHQELSQPQHSSSTLHSPRGSTNPFSLLEPYCFLCKPYMRQTSKPTPYLIEGPHHPYLFKEPTTYTNLTRWNWSLVTHWSPSSSASSLNFAHVASVKHSLICPPLVPLVVTKRCRLQSIHERSFDALVRPALASLTRNNFHISFQALHFFSHKSGTASHLKDCAPSCIEPQCAYTFLWAT